MKPASTVRLEFDPKLEDKGGAKPLRDGLSAALQVGDTLWVANDESTSLERLSLANGRGARRYSYARSHKRFALADCLQLPLPPADEAEDPAEVDVEGMDFDDGYLWLVGSHSLKRRKPEAGQAQRAARKRLAKLRVDGNRFLLARIPVVDANGAPSLAKSVTRNGRRRTAAQLHGNARGNDLTKALRSDKHLGPFLAIPGKDNGFDIEGLAAVGKRVFLGLRGPVLGGWAVILELHIEVDARSPSTLRLKPIGQDRELYRKHFLDLGGLGIRELCVRGADLLILGGPSMDLDGPVRVFRWRGGTRPQAERMVPATELQRVLELPFREGEDHAEGMTLYAPDGGAANSLLVVYDSASAARKSGKHAVAADVFRLRRSTARG
jgi:hypothetical protein